MVTPGTRVMVEVPCYGEVMDNVKAELLAEVRLNGTKLES